MKLLRKQRKQLLKLVEICPLVDNCPEGVTDKQYDAVEGMVNLCDFILDAESDGRTLPDTDVDSIVEDLEVLYQKLATFPQPSGSARRELALRRAISFLMQDPA
jgi:hypothetical protein